MVKKLEPIGSFVLKTSTVMMSDPCYSLDTWCQLKVENVQTGEWNAYIKQSDEGDWGVRISELIAVKSDKPLKDRWKRIGDDGIIGVDSGQAGIFDLKHYRDDSVILKRAKYKIAPGGNHALWYAECCEITLARTGAGVIPYGCVSSSGIGDGAYNAYKQENKDGIYALRIKFL